MSITTGRLALGTNNALKLGLFGANCSSGRAATTVSERWSGSWDDNLALARLADSVGIDFMLPIGRWKGYGGITDFEGETSTIIMNTRSWAVTGRRSTSS
jgi:dimethylsulfone monooxygenase